MSRRKFMKILAASSGGAVLVSCGKAGTPEKVTVVQTQEIEKLVTPTVEKLESADVLGTFPRSETIINDILTGRCGSPDNFNEWVGWKNRDRGMQTLANEPLWTVDFATGEIVNGLADGDPSTTRISPAVNFLFARASTGTTASPSLPRTWSTRSRRCWRTKSGAPTAS